MPNRRAQKSKPSSKKGSRDRIIVTSTFVRNIVCATGVSAVSVLDPLSLPAPIVTEAQIRKYYRIIGFMLEWEPLNASSAQYDAAVAFVPGQLESTPTSQTPTTLIGFIHNMYTAVGCTVPKHLKLTNAQLKELCQFPDCKYVCEPSAAANASEEVQASIAVAHTSAGSVTFYLKGTITFEFWDFVGSVINPMDDKLAKLAQKCALLEKKMVTYEKGTDQFKDDQGKFVKFPIYDLATRTPEQRALQDAFMDAMVRAGVYKKSNDGGYALA